MVLYSNQAMSYLGGVSAEQMESYIYENMAWTNQAFINSEISLSFNIVYLGLVRAGTRARLHPLICQVDVELTESMLVSGVRVWTCF